MDGFWNAIVAITALVAIILSFITIRLQRKANRDQTYLRLHEILMSDEMRNGRARLIEAGKTNTLPEFGSAGYWQMAHALGGLETAGVYIDSGLMSRKQFVAIWHHQLRAIRTGTGLMAAHRIKDLDNWAPWPHLRPLLDAAASFYDKSLICCQQPGQWPPLNRSQAARSTTRNVDRRQQPRQQPPPTKPVIYEPENSLERPEAAE